jgi:preprotein translocase subunit SecF
MLGLLEQKSNCMYVIKHRRFLFALTGFILAGAIGAVAFLGLPLSIDFTGGSLVEVSYAEARPEIDEIKSAVNNLALGEISLRESGETGVVLRTRTLTPLEHESVLSALSLSDSAAFTELRFNSIGPSLGSELAIKALYALLAVIISIMLYIAWAFRTVSRPISSWLYGFTVVVILIHDVIVPLGFYAILAAFTGAQVDSLFVVALLAILGYSVNDTIVIFDRVREHLHNNETSNVDEPFDEVVGKSITETMGRSINTSLTVALALIALIFLGSPVTVNFALVLLVGVVAGTYSSVLVAAPLLVPLANKFARKQEIKK